MRGIDGEIIWALFLHNFLAMVNVSPAEYLPNDSLSPVPVIASRVELDASVRKAFEDFCQELHRQAVVRHQRWGAQSTHLKLPPPMTLEQVNKAFRFLGSGSDGLLEKSPTILNEYYLAFENDTALLQRFLRHPQLPPVAMVRALIFTRYWDPACRPVVV